MPRPALRTAILTFATLLLSGCFIRPRPLDSKEQWTNAQAAIDFYSQGQEEINKPISLPEAIARALKYNLDYRVRSTQVALANGQLTMAKLSLLPKLNTNFDANSRSNSLRSLDSDFQPVNTINPRT